MNFGPGAEGDSGLTMEMMTATMTGEGRFTDSARGGFLVSGT